MAHGTSSFEVFKRWYQSIESEAIVREGRRVSEVLMYRDIELAIDHTPEVAAPWALIVQYLLPFEPETAHLVWQEFTKRFIMETPQGMHVAIVPRSPAEDTRVTCLATWLSREIGDTRTFEALLHWADKHYEPRYDEEKGEFGYWFGLDEPFPRGQWNNAIINAFVGTPGVWSSLLQ